MSRDIIDVTEIAQRRVEVVSSTLTYIGVTLSPASDTSQNVWQISRITLQGGQTITEYANSGKFTSIWDDRATLFPVPPFFNEKSISFDGVNELLDGGDIHKYDVNDAWSISFWVKPNNVASTKLLFSKAGGAGVKGYMFRHNTGGALFLQMRTSTVTRTHTFNTTLTGGVWDYITFTYSGGGNMNGVKVYKNGVIDSTLPGSSTLTGTLLLTNPFQMGSRSGGFFFSGKMDEITVWDKELNQSEVTELYNSGTPNDASGHSASANLKSWYRCGDSDVNPTVSDKQGTDDLTMVNMDDSNFGVDTP